MKFKQPQQVRLPFLFACTLAFGMFLGLRMSEEMRSGNHSFFKFSFKQSDKLSDVIGLIADKYVDSVNVKELEKLAIAQILSKLDPHSVYVEAADFVRMNQSLEGNFEGIGIEFHVLKDTIYVVSAVAGGPAFQAGIQAGDKIIAINEEPAAGKQLTNEQVIEKLRGMGGTSVLLRIYRPFTKKTFNVSLIRAQIPLSSIDVAYLINEQTGYIKISKFAATTHKEFLAAFEKLNANNLQNLIIDLRGNGGGYLNAATALADEFLPEKQLIVYTEGRKQARSDYFSSSIGEFEEGNLVLLIDEGSASASEIVAGAVQDLERGTIIGRRSFGKGLVQDQTKFADGSALRLTIARYYTPLGRCIQKSYEGGKDVYEQELNRRLLAGKLTSLDTGLQNGSKVFKTRSGKIVYGGGGISPDIFVPLDTSGFSAYYTTLNVKGIINEYSYVFTDQNRQRLNKQYSGFEAFNKLFDAKQLLSGLAKYGAENGVKRDDAGLRQSGALIARQLKALVARQIWGNEAYYRAAEEADPVLKRAIVYLNGI